MIGFLMEVANWGRAVQYRTCTVRLCTINDFLLFTFFLYRNELFSMVYYFPGQALKSVNL